MNTPQSISRSSSAGIKEIMRKQSMRTTGAVVLGTEVVNTPPESSTGSSLRKALKEGTITPEKAIQEAFPSPFTKISDISLELLKIHPLPTGFRILDRHLVLKQGRPELVVVGAGTSHGKSAFMLQVAAEISKSHPVFVFSLEMDERDIKARLLADKLSQPLDQIMEGRIPLSRLTGADDEFKKMNLHLCTNGRREIQYIQSSSYDLAKQEGRPGLIVVDYLQLMRGPVKGTRTAEIAEILCGLKSLAKEMGCPVLIGSQLNRSCERRGKQLEMETGQADYTPMKSDLMDSGSIEHDADVIMFLSRHYVYDQETRPNSADFIIAKNRNGKIGKWVLDFCGTTCSFKEQMKGVP